MDCGTVEENVCRKQPVAFILSREFKHTFAPVSPFFYSVLTCSSTVPARGGRDGGSRGVLHLEVPVGVGCGQHELELHDAGVVLQLTVLDAVEFISDVSSTNIHLRNESENHVLDC